MEYLGCTTGCRRGEIERWRGVGECAFSKSILNDESFARDPSRKDFPPLIDTNERSSTLHYGLARYSHLSLSVFGEVLQRAAAIVGPP